MHDSDGSSSALAASRRHRLESSNSPAARRQAGIRDGSGMRRQRDATATRLRRLRGDASVRCRRRRERRMDLARPSLREGCASSASQRSGVLPSRRPKMCTTLQGSVGRSCNRRTKTDVTVETTYETAAARPLKSVGRSCNRRTVHILGRRLGKTPERRRADDELPCRPTFTSLLSSYFHDWGMTTEANPGIWTVSDRFARKTITLYRVIVLHAERSLASGLTPTSCGGPETRRWKSWRIKTAQLERT